VSYTLPLARLIEEFRKLPGIGPKSAQRLAFHVLKRPEEDVRRFADVLMDARDKVGCCALCFNLSAQQVCELCQQADRKRDLLCVVAEPRDLYALERTGEYKGLYHVLQGLISPLEGIGPEELKIRELIARLSMPVWQHGGQDPANSGMENSAFSNLQSANSGWGNPEATLSQETSSTSAPPISEIILALPPSIEGDTTSLYISRLIKPLGVRLTRIAFGLPVGADLEYADSMTITRALQGRQLV
jgi:recombination protein RecR